MNEYSSETLCNLYLWLRRRLDFFRCAVDNTMGQNTMAFLMFSCLRGVGSSRRSLAACAFDACIPRWCMALLLRLALLPALMSSEPHACFLRSHTGAAEYSRPGRRFCPRVEQKPLEPDVRPASGLQLSDCLPPRAPLPRGASRHRRDFTPHEIKE